MRSLYPWSRQDFKIVLIGGILFISVAIAAGSFGTFEGEYSIVRPGENFSAPSSLAIDNNTATCSSTLQSLSVRFPWPIFGRTVLLYMNLYPGAVYDFYAGSHLSNNGTDNRKIFSYDKATTVVNAKTLILSSFVRDVTIVQVTASSSTKFEVCEVQLQQGGFLLIN